MTLTKTAIIRQKIISVLMSTADTGNLFGRIWIAQKQGLQFTEMGPSVGQKG
jgi:hypothetical protein